MENIFNEIVSVSKMRFYPGQKQRFRDYATKKFADMGYDVSVDRHKNVIVGNADTAKYVATAHYDTPPLSFYLTPFTRMFGQIAGMFVAMLVMIGVLVGLSVLAVTLWDDLSGVSSLVYLIFVVLLLFPNPNNANDNTSGIVSVFKLAEKLKGNANADEYAFILFNNEEWGLLGSGGFRKDYAKKHHIQPHFEVFNLDCVGRGDSLLLAYKKTCTTSEKLLTSIQQHNLPYKTIKANLFTVGSDNLHFSNSAMVTSTKKSWCGAFYLPAIHMPHDKKIDVEIMEKVVDVVYDAMTV